MYCVDMRSGTVVVDLTQPLGPRTALWPGSPPFAARVTAEIEPDGLYNRALATPEHAGTHLDAPAHFVAGGARVDAIPADRLIVPCAVVDARGVGIVDADFLRADEERHGAFARDSAVLVHTGWDRFVDDHETYVDALEFPGLDKGAAELLVERGVAGLGIDTLGVDPGSSTTFDVHHTTLPAGLWHLEGLVNLGALPPRGALLFVGALRLVDGSGTPARVLALVSPA
jgi:kynurenine formamidase